MLPLQRVEERLQVVNQFIVPLLRATKRYSTLWSQVTRLIRKPTKIYTSRDYTVSILVIDLPASKPLVLVYYISTQRSRPLSPSQLEQRMRSMRRHVEKIRGKLFESADIIYTIYAPKGLTQGARRKAKRNFINIARSSKELLAPLARYITRRFQRLIESIRSKRIWGELPILIYAFQEIGRSIGARIDDVLDPPTVLKLSLKGGTISLLGRMSPAY
ncbi:hypothetical protein PYJP_19280 [Pyrofollis japonicus]|uniref:hypothetical protein n=1 Tax=Pyrofollis japonicus TaxID=3060460 RepID=UPI00295B24A2|nr:hypothetical protein [Pyrofollis japonicus]BEP18576.1 hypothetical protein PYJP_19280 [Pyrofollis japonicus]